MKTLYLFRHAKSSWDEPLEDHERPLAPRGERAAPAMAEHMMAEDLVPERVLCSTAARTRQTWERMAPILRPEPPVKHLDRIYEAGVDGLLGLVRGQDDRAGTIMVVGHNPSLQELALELAGSGPSRALKRLGKKFPTAALAVIEHDVTRWPDVAPGEGRLVHFTRPKDLPEAKARGL